MTTCSARSCSTQASAASSSRPSSANPSARSSCTNASASSSPAVRAGASGSTCTSAEAMTSPMTSRCRRRRTRGSREGWAITAPHSTSTPREGAPSTTRCAASSSSSSPRSTPLALGSGATTARPSSSRPEDTSTMGPASCFSAPKAPKVRSIHASTRSSGIWKMLRCIQMTSPAGSTGKCRGSAIATIGTVST